MATVSEAERARMRRLGALLAAHESDDYGDQATRASLVDSANRWRARHDLPDLQDDCEAASILAVHRRARALGLPRPRR